MATSTNWNNTVANVIYPNDNEEIDAAEHQALLQELSTSIYWRDQGAPDLAGNIIFKDMFGQVYGRTAPVSGNLTFLMDNARRNATALVVHQDTVAPVLPVNVIDIGIDYRANQVNYLLFTYLDDNKILAKSLNRTRGGKVSLQRFDGRVQTSLNAVTDPGRTYKIISSTTVEMALPRITDVDTSVFYFVVELSKDVNTATFEIVKDASDSYEAGLVNEDLTLDQVGGNKLELGSEGVYYITAANGKWDVAWYIKVNEPLGITTAKSLTGSGASNAPLDVASGIFESGNLRFDHALGYVNQKSAPYSGDLTIDLTDAKLLTSGFFWYLNSVTPAWPAEVLRAATPGFVANALTLYRYTLIDLTPGLEKVLIEKVANDTPFTGIFEAFGFWWDMKAGVFEDQAAYVEQGLLKIVRNVGSEGPNPILTSSAQSGARPIYNSETAYMATAGADPKRMSINPTDSLGLLEGQNRTYAFVVSTQGGALEPNISALLYQNDNNYIGLNHNNLSLRFRANRSGGQVEIDTPINTIVSTQNTIGNEGEGDFNFIVIRQDGNGLKVWNNGSVILTSAEKPIGWDLGPGTWSIGDETTFFPQFGLKAFMISTLALSDAQVGELTNYLQNYYFSGIGELEIGTDFVVQ